MVQAADFVGTINPRRAPKSGIQFGYQECSRTRRKEAQLPLRSRARRDHIGTADPPSVEAFFGPGNLAQHPSVTALKSTIRTGLTCCSGPTTPNLELGGYVVLHPLFTRWSPSKRVSTSTGTPRYH